MELRNKFILLFLLLISILETKIFAQRPKLNVEICILGFDTTSKCNTDNKKDTVYLMQISIINKSKKEVKFGHMSCNWLSQFELLKGSIQACDWGCDKNSPTMTTIKAGMKYRFGIFIKRKSNSNLEIQLQFHYVPSIEFLSFIRRNSKKNPKKIVYLSNVCRVESNHRVKFFYKEQFQKYLIYNDYLKNYLK